MFDPFNDFEQSGYLRNLYGEKDPEIVRELEHTMFRAGLDDALAYLEKRDILCYEDFLEVHRILFQEFYPWAGKDRQITAPNCSVSKAGTIFCHPIDARRAVDEGLRIGQDKISMRERPGEVMGFFAYGHPFLDGNGRTMLIIHNELCHRAGFSINWHLTNKVDYLKALSAEIETPLKGHLDNYLGPFIGQPRERGLWSESIHGLSGLDGQSIQNTVDGEYSDASVAQKYQSFEINRGI
ncbi:Fic/DOC family protein [Vibrio spartinae]|uniref:protein adenylyltransferase n=1 Tax=Vibrio spartinae TaxID=1918945 RepID=A0ABX6QWV9_9VIBR|nr:Fic family protein [Vibrio spartinae]QMV13532.1 Adenosine monophosphate-protein transferase VbhT [Vibrio spartinae]